MFLSFQLTSCIFISVSIPPPHNVKLKVVADGSILVTWEPSKESRLTGYEVFCHMYELLLCQTQLHFYRTVFVNQIQDS